MNNFMLIMSAVLAANMLTALVLYAFISYDRLERQGKATGLDATLRLGSIVMALGFCLAGLLLYGNG